MATRRARKKRSPGSQKTGVLGLLEWMRWELPYFKEVILRDYSEDDARVAVFVVFNKVLAPAFSKRMETRQKVADVGLDEERRVALRALLVEALADGPELLDVELTSRDYGKEDKEDFEEDYQPHDLPGGVFLFFELLRKKIVKKGIVTSAADDPAADAGGPGYVIRDPNAPGIGEGMYESYLDPDWPTWVPNPLKSKKDDATAKDKEDALKLAALLDATCNLLRPTWPSWAFLAKELRDAGNTLMDGVTITASNVRRVVIAAELLLGNKRPDIDL